MTEEDYSTWTARELTLALHGMALAEPASAGLLKECSGRILVGDAEEALVAIDSVDKEYLDLLRVGQKIKAIRAYRQNNNGCGLATAKDAVELLAVKHRIKVIPNIFR